MIFTSRLKRGSIMAPFVVLINAFYSDFDNSERVDFVLKLIKMIIWNWNLLLFCKETRMVIHLFYLHFLLAMATQKIYIKEKIWTVRSCISFRYEWLKFPHYLKATYREVYVRDNVKTVHFSTFLKHWVIWGFNLKDIAQTNKRAYGFSMLGSNELLTVV